MKRRTGVTFALTALLLIVISTSADAERYVSCPLRSTASTSECTPGPSLKFTLSAAITPEKLPRQQMAAATLKLKGKIATTDGTQPSALREVILDFDKDVALNPAGLQTCKRTLLEASNVRTARRVCRSSIVGKGVAHIAIAPDANKPILLALTLFNGGVRDGKSTLYIHSFLTTPSPTALVASVAIRRHRKGLRTVAKIPTIAGGDGSLLDFNFTIERTFRQDRTQHSYLEARCPDQTFKLTAPSIVFRNEAHEPGAASTTVLKGGIAVPCIPSA